MAKGKKMKHLVISGDSSKGTNKVFKKMSKKAEAEGMAAVLFEGEIDAEEVKRFITQAPVGHAILKIGAKPPIEIVIPPPPDKAIEEKDKEEK